MIRAPLSVSPGGAPPGPPLEKIFPLSFDEEGRPVYRGGPLCYFSRPLSASLPHDRPDIRKAPAGRLLPSRRALLYLFRGAAYHSSGSTRAICSSQSCFWLAPQRVMTLCGDPVRSQCSAEMDPACAKVLTASKHLYAPNGAPSSPQAPHPSLPRRAGKLARSTAAPLPTRPGVLWGPP